jgi:hypothetical protein
VYLCIFWGLCTGRLWQAADKLTVNNFLLDLYRKALTLPEKTFQLLFRPPVPLKKAHRLFPFCSDKQQTINLTTWNNEALKNCPKLISHYPLEQAGNWADSIASYAPIISTTSKPLPT